MSTDGYRIVVGVDGSADARAALDWAMEHAAIHRRSHIDLVHAWLAPTTGGMMSVDRFDQVRAHGAQLLADAEHVAQATNGVAITSHLEHGSASWAILHHADGADLVVVGTRGRGPVTSVLLGSVSRTVVSRAEIAVAVISRTTSRRDGPIVVGVDDSPDARAALRWAAEHARRSGTKLKVVHAFQPRHLAGLFGVAKLQPDVLWRNEATAALRSLIETELRGPLEVDLEAVATQVGPADGLLDAADGAALIVLGTRGGGGAATILLGSVGSEVLRRATSPVITIPATGTAGRVTDGEV